MKTILIIGSTGAMGTAVAKSLLGECTGDYEQLKKLNPSLRKFRTWLHDTGWKGEARAMRKNAADGDT